MTRFKYLFLIPFTLFISNLELNANHLVGGEFVYECLGDNNYQIGLTIYRDCNAQNAANFDEPAHIFFFDDNGDLIDILEMGFNQSGVVNIEPNTDDLCSGTAPDICVEFFAFSETLVLPPTAGGITMVYQRCCRNEGALNIPMPGSTGSTYELYIPHESDCNNSSPVFNNLPPLIICEDFPFEFDYSATDPDGDELLYSVCTPFDGANEADPEPGAPGQAAVPFPYAPVVWSNGFDEDNQLGMGSTFEIDSNTGLLTIVPQDVGLYIIGICVSEFRNGELISTSIRDYQFTVLPCDLVSVDAGEDIVLCESGPVQLDGSAIGATNTSWTPTDAFDDPNILNPIIENAQAGTYTLNGNNDADCGDSDEVEIIILDPIEVFISEECSQEDFTTTFIIGFGGGYPAYNSDASYTVTGLVNAEIGSGETVTVNGDYSGTSITLGVVDDWGCTNNFTYGPIECIKLAIELESFTAMRMNESAVLKWDTRTETNNDYFIIQSSKNGQDFESLATVSGAGNSLEPRHYSYLDQSLGTDASYYRLLAVDFDGRATSSNINLVNALDVEFNEELSVYPTIVQDWLYTNLQSPTIGKISVYDLQGRLVHTQSEISGAINLSHLASSVYWIELQADKQHSVIKVFKR